MTRYLLDTDICIYLLKGFAKKAVQKFESLTPGDVAVSSITTAELFYGAQKSQHIDRNTSAIEKFISPLIILPFDTPSAYHYGRIRKQLEVKGKVIGQMDMLIASIAITHELIMVTNNVREFKRIQGLRVENWT